MGVKEDWNPYFFSGIEVNCIQDGIVNIGYLNRKPGGCVAIAIEVDINYADVSQFWFTGDTMAGGALINLDG